MITRCLLSVVLPIACSGCIGLTFDRTTTETIERPIPLRAPLNATAYFDRWACQPPPGSTPLTKSDFLASWGEPNSKEVSAEKETWIYAESGRWCGIWRCALPASVLSRQALWPASSPTQFSLLLGPVWPLRICRAAVEPRMG